VPDLTWLYTLRQASRPSWRIGQKLPWKVYYFYYGNTIQARAMALMGKKLSASPRKVKRRSSGPSG
jgi:hypothetical protein